MARYTAALELPRLDGIGAALSQTLIALGLDLVQTTAVQIAASASAPPWPQSMQLLFCWSPPPPGSTAVAITLEVMSRESMTLGAPRTRQAMAELLEALQQQLPDLQIHRREAGFQMA